VDRSKQFLAGVISEHWVKILVFK